MSTLALKKRDVEIGEAVNEAATLRALMRECAAELDAAAALKVGVMDSDSKAHAVGNQRLDAMQAVALRLREA